MPPPNNKNLEKKVDLLLEQGESTHGKLNTFIAQLEEGNKELFMLAQEVANIKSQCRLILKNINDAENNVSEQSLHLLRTRIHRLARLAKD